jgi:hypothetical protein
MTVAIQEKPLGFEFVEIDLSNKLSKEDFQSFVPEMERLIQQRGKLRVLVRMHDFHGWTSGGLWEDMKFETKHFKDFDRIAFVGEKRWEATLSSFCKALTPAEIRYFDADQLDAARAWLQSA